MGGLPIFIYFAFMLAYLYVIYKYRRDNLLLLILSCIYTFSALMSIVLYNSEAYSTTYKDVNFFSYILLYFLVIISFYPVKNNRALMGSMLVCSGTTLTRCFTFYLILLYLPQTILYIPETISNYQNILLDFEYAADMYDETAEVTHSQTGHNFSNLFSVFRGAFSQILVFWTFYYSCIDNKNKWFLYSLWICSLYPFFASFSNGSRTGIVWWMFEVLIAYLIFYKFLPPKTNRTLKIGLVVLISFVIVIFSILTIGRFSTREYEGTNEVNNSIVLYSGSGQLNFADDVIQNDVIQYGDNCFPLFRSIIGLSSSKNLYERQAKWGKVMKIRQGAFYTLYGDLCFDMSYWGAFVFFVFLAYKFNKRLSYTDYNYTVISNAFLLYFYCCILYNGLFYFSYKTIGGNLAIITNIAFYYLIKHSSMNNTQFYKTYGKIYRFIFTAISPNPRK